jgi:hypothetical protein
VTQRKRVLRILKDAGPKGVSSKTFIESYLPRAAARVRELKDEGYEIRSEREERSQFVRYYLVSESAQAGLCECGCGQKPSIAEQTRSDRGEVKGEPRRFVLGHQKRKTGPLFEEDPDTGIRDIRAGRTWKDVQPLPIVGDRTEGRDQAQEGRSAPVEATLSSVSDEGTARSVPSMFDADDCLSWGDAA